MHDAAVLQTYLEQKGKPMELLVRMLIERRSGRGQSHAILDPGAALECICVCRRYHVGLPRYPILHLHHHHHHHYSYLSTD